MRNTRRTILVAVAGVVVAVGIVGVSLAAWFFVSVFDAGPESHTAATRSFDQVRQRFGGSAPVVEIHNDEPVFTRQPQMSGPQPRLNTLHALAWDPDDQEMTRMEMPFWLIRLKAEPFEVAVDAADVSGRFEITVAEVERYGPALLLDHQESGSGRVLVWTD